MKLHLMTLEVIPPVTINSELHSFTILCDLIIIIYRLLGRHDSSKCLFEAKFTKDIQQQMIGRYQ